MFQDEAERISDQIRRTIPGTVVKVLNVERGDFTRDDKWRVKGDELRTKQGGRGICLWIHTTQEWMRLQHWWSRMAEVQAQALDTIYTVLEDKGVGGFYALILTPSARMAGNCPSQMAYFDDPGEASQEVKASYGQDAIYVEPEQFSKIVEDK